MKSKKKSGSSINVKKILLSPMTVITCAVLGVVMGLTWPKTAMEFSIFGDLYVSFLKLLAIPILISALSSSIADMIVSRKKSSFDISILKSTVIMFALMAVTTVTAAAMCYVSGLDKPSQDADIEQLNNMMNQPDIEGAEIEIEFYHDTNVTQKPAGEFVLGDFIRNNMPTNIFQSLYNGDSLQLLITSILVGMALGFMPGRKAHVVISTFSAFFGVCMQLLKWSLYVLPLCVFSLMADTTANLGIECLEMMTSYFAVSVGVVFGLTVVTALIWAVVAKVSPFALVRDMGRGILLAFCSGRTVVSLPVMMQDMEEKMHYDGRYLRLVMPFAFTIGKFSQCVQLICLVVFISGLYSAPLSIVTIAVYCLILIPVVSITDDPKIGIAILLQILILPEEIAVILLVAGLPVCGPLGAAHNAVSCGLFSSIILRNSKRSSKALGSEREDAVVNGGASA